jgi:3,4-dihydroxy 2-butanone 4-phosphate synthase/GTP cyclohydrolase II
VILWYFLNKNIIIDRYRRKTDKLVDRSSAAQIPTMWGPFTAYCYRSILDGIEHIAMVKVSN